MHTNYNYFSVPGIRVSERITQARIVYFVSTDTGVSYFAMQAKTRQRPIVEARQIAIYIIRRLTSMTLAEIAELFGGRDHTTMIHSVKTVEDLMFSDELLKEKVERIISKILQN